MTKLLLSAVIWAQTGVMAAPLPRELYKDLTPGPYLVRIQGMMTHACARVIQAELSKHPMISKAEASYAKETATFTIKPNGRLTMRELKSILDRAAKRMRLSRYEIADVRYMPSVR